MRLNLAQYFQLGTLAAPRAELAMPLPVDRGVPIEGLQVLDRDTSWLPFEYMAPGDSFFVPVHRMSIDIAEAGLLEAADDYAIALRTSDCTGLPTFTIRRVAGGLRCWRTS